ncbi:MAG TPA: 4'-phosphopantetheinyl transferase superfamily protein, partial [Solirubrobacteraceae bacterium]
MQISTERIQGGRAFPSVAALLAERADVTGRLDPLAVLTLADADVSVWIMRLEDGQESLRAARAILSPSERVRCDRVIDPLRRGRLVLARASLRVILAQELNVTVGEVRIHRSNAGRPALDGEDVPSFSLSHTGEWAAVAVSSLARVGIDIEGAGRPISLTLIDRLLTPAEASSSARESPLSRRRAFLAHWTAKEA